MGMQLFACVSKSMEEAWGGERARLSTSRQSGVFCFAFGMNEVWRLVLFHRYDRRLMKWSWRCKSLLGLESAVAWRE